MDEDGIANKLFPQHMEEVICEIDGVEACGVVVKEHDIRKNAPVVFVVVKDNDVTWEHIKEYIQDNLPSYYEPLKVIIVKEIPKTASQKIDYAALEKIEID